MKLGGCRTFKSALSTSGLLQRRRCNPYLVLACAACSIRVALLPAEAYGAQPQPCVPPADQPTLYVTATAHLDTQWLWTIQKTINEYLPRTLRDNFALFEKYPDYTFSFEGAFRYMLAKEYYPEEYAKLKEYVAKGRWHVCGSFVDACDVNVPSPESLIRHILYGNNFFEREFGRSSRDVFLPDCFGFGYALPSVAAHCGLKGFSTQKLTWGSSVPIPFDIGVWEGVDGSTIFAALNPGDYVSKITNDLSTDEDWSKRITGLGQSSGLYAGYKYFGVGDEGGAPDDESVRWLQEAIHNGGNIRVVSAPPDRLFQDISPLQAARLPRYKGEFLMTRHGTGCYTSQAAMKRWNRKNELLADAAERASVVAAWLRGAAYPHSALQEAWVRFLWHQFHDDLTGTSIPQAYTFSWNDEIIALQQFAGILENAVGAVARALDTQVKGIPVVVFNPLAVEREDVVTATVRFPGTAPRYVHVVSADGVEVPSQIQRQRGNKLDLLFAASLPSVGFAVFDVQAAERPEAASGNLIVDISGLENDRYRVRLDDNGDVASIFDKTLERELLAGPARLALFQNTPKYWSEWEIRYEDVSAEPYGYVCNPAQVRVIESGPARASLEVTRQTAGSTVIQRISLAAGKAGDRVEFDTLVDWRTPQTLLKAVFPTTASNDTAAYDLGFGVIDRPNNSEAKYEVPAQQWADLTHRDGSFGVTVINDCKYGWDKPADNTIRLTLVHSPNVVEKDMGWHRFTYALSGHSGDWREGCAITNANRVNQPLAPFQTVPHPGPLGKRFSLLTVESPQVIVRAVKKAEKTDEIIVRLQESYGRLAQGVEVAFGAQVLSAREVNGAEQPLRTLNLGSGKLRLDFTGFQPRTVALGVTRSSSLQSPATQPVQLPYDVDVVSSDGSRSDGDFDGAGHSLPAELLPETIVAADIPFAIGPKADSQPNAVQCRGQTVELPKGDYDKLYILAAATEGTPQATFTVGEERTNVYVRAFSGWIGQAASLVSGERLLATDTMAPAFIHNEKLAWVGTHRHDGRADRNEPYVFCYLFNYRINLAVGTDHVTLPSDERIRILAMTVARNPNDDTIAAHPLYDQAIAAQMDPPGGLFIAPATVQLAASTPGAGIVYTLDGSLPDESSPRYTAPLRLTSSTKVAARVLYDGVLEEFATRGTFTFTQPREPETPVSTLPGLQFNCFDGEWERLPEFAALKPVVSGVGGVFALDTCGRSKHYGVTWRGFIRVPEDGVYTFYLAGDDGSKLLVGDKLVVDNDGLHGMRERSGQTALRAGLHSLNLLYFQRTGDASLTVHYEGPGIPRQSIPATSFCHSETD